MSDPITGDLLVVEVRGDMAQLVRELVGVLEPALIARCKLDDVLTTDAAFVEHPWRVTAGTTRNTRSENRGIPQKLAGHRFEQGADIARIGTPQFPGATSIDTARALLRMTPSGSRGSNFACTGLGMATDDTANISRISLQPRREPHFLIDPPGIRTCFHRKTFGAQYHEARRGAGQGAARPPTTLCLVSILAQGRSCSA